MFEDKTMVADTLAGINGELMRFGEMIPQTENKELKTTLKQFRAACEQSQEELYQIARILPLPISRHGYFSSQPIISLARFTQRFKAQLLAVSP